MANLSKLVTILKDTNNKYKYEDYLKTIKKNDYTRIHNYSTIGSSNVYQSTLIFIILRMMDSYLGFKKGYYQKSFSEITDLYNNDEVIKEKVKMFNHCLEHTNINSLNEEFTQNLIYTIISNPTPIFIIDSLIKAGLDYTKKINYGNDRINVVFLFLQNRKDWYDISLFKYLIYLPKININELSYNNSVLSLICNNQLYDNSKYIEMFNELIRHPKIDVNAGVPILGTIGKTTITTNKYFFDALSEHPNFDINAEKTIPINGNYKNKVDFFYYLINNDYFNESDNFTYYYNWCLKNKKINIYKNYSNEENKNLEDTIFSCLIMNLYSAINKKDNDYNYDYTKTLEYRCLYDFILWKKPQINKKEAEVLRFFGGRFILKIKVLIKRQQTSSLSGILNSIEE
jgi:hypothetical protein